MLNISETEKKTLYIWLIVGIIIVLLTVLFFYKKSEKEKEEIKSITASDTNKVIDRNKYYTVKGAIEKFYSFINMNDYDSVSKILDQNYINKNNINKENYLEKLSISDSSTFEPEIMCLKNVKKGIYTYVINGHEVISNTGEEKEEKYYEIALDGNTFTFVIRPTNKSIYEEVCNG